MRRTLGFGNMNRDDINASYKNILDLLPGLDPKTLIEIANSIWYRLGFPVLPQFVDVSRRFFDAAVQSTWHVTAQPVDPRYYYQSVGSIYQIPR